MAYGTLLARLTVGTGLSVEEAGQLSPGVTKHILDELESKQEWEDYLNARLCAVIANANRDRKKKPRPYAPKDFMVTGKAKRKKISTSAEQLKYLKSILG